IPPAKPIMMTIEALGGRAAPIPPLPASTVAATAEVLRAVRKAKSEAKLSMRAEVEHVVVSGKRAESARAAAGDIAAAGRAAGIDFQATDEGELSVEVTLPPAEEDGAAG
ncbi:hypothetical protein ABZY35_11430, partial [Nocardiopsis alba]